MISSNQKRLITIVAPACNEAAVIKIFYEKLIEVMENNSGGYDWEIIFVDDGSTDNTLEILKELRQKDQKIKWISFSRNFGQQSALTAGLEYAKGDAVITMDCDLQHPASLIPEMITQWEAGFDLVLTVREDDDTIGLTKKFTSTWFYRLINALSNIPIKPSAVDFRLMSRKAVNGFLRFGEMHRFIRGMVSWMGYRTCELSYKPQSRPSGRSKYTPKKMINFAIDGLTSFSIIPLRVSTILGFLIFLGALSYALYAIIVWFIKPQSLQVGWTSLLVTINLLGGAILLFIGIIGEYIGRIYEQVKMRPLYLIDEMDGFDEESGCRSEFRDGKKT
ncbi:MAG: glycosyltransferase family 2 protein [Nitrospirota bacterium]